MLLNIGQEEALRVTIGENCRFLIAPEAIQVSGEAVDETGDHHVRGGEFIRHLGPWGSDAPTHDVLKRW